MCVRGHSVFCVCVHVKKNVAQAYNSTTIALFTILVYLNLHEEERLDSWLTACKSAHISNPVMCDLVDPNEAMK